VAACLGDLITISLLGGVSNVLIYLLTTPLPLIIVILIIISSTACGIFTSLNPDFRPLMTHGWTPLFGAMAISCGTGIVLDTFVGRYQDFALLAAIITGLCSLCLCSKFQNVEFVFRPSRRRRIYPCFTPFVITTRGSSPPATLSINFFPFLKTRTQCPCGHGRPYARIFANSGSPLVCAPPHWMAPPSAHIHRLLLGLLLCRGECKAESLTSKYETDFDDRWSHRSFSRGG
jgi:hypothetical protein